MARRKTGLGLRPTGHERRRMALWAVAGVILVIAMTVLAFGRASLFPSGYEARAIFASGSQLKKGSAVRRAGLDVGKVVRVEASTDGRALVTMRIAPDEAPIRTDARLAIKPRLAFEGNFYIDVTGGTTSGRVLRDGVVLPISQTSVPVQVDQVLSSFDRSTREASRGVVRSLSRSLDAPGSDPGGTGAAGLRDAARELARALPPVARVSRGARGQRPGDLGRALRSTADLTATLARDPGALAGIVDGYSRVLATLADHDRDLMLSVRGLSSTLRTAPASLTKLNRMLPRITAFATALRPALDELPATLGPTNAAFAQLDGLVRRDELPALAGALERPALALPLLIRQVRTASDLVAPVGRCLREQIVPVLNKRVPDGDLSVDQPAWLEVLHAAANLTGGSPGFDGNGSTFRAGIGAGTNVVNGALPSLGNAVGNFDEDLEGVRPVWLGNGIKPPKRPDVACDTQDDVNLESRVGTPFGGRMKPVSNAALPQSADELRDRTREALAPLLEAVRPRESTRARKEPAATAADPRDAGSREGRGSTAGPRVAGIPTAPSGDRGPASPTVDRVVRGVEALTDRVGGVLTGVLGPGAGR